VPGSAPEFRGPNQSPDGALWKASLLSADASSEFIHEFGNSATADGLSCFRMIYSDEPHQPWGEIRMTSGGGLHFLTFRERDS
jgi:hypothetical protein